MKHVCNLIPLEEAAIPPEVRIEAMSSKSRVRTRLEEVVGRIKNQNQELANPEASSAMREFEEELDPIANPD